MQHGDLLGDTLRSGDTAVLIDGVYHQAPALRLKEILAAMGRGVRVIGAASIGALRAAELAPFGMLGIGHIFTAYMRGEIDGDDEVAVGQAPDGDRQALTWPVVNLRYALQLAVSVGILDGERAAVLLKALAAVYYPQRTMAAVRAVCRRHGESEFAEWLAGQRAHDEHFADLKRADALAAVRTALDGQSPSAVHVSPHMWQTRYFRHWSNALASSRVDGLTLGTEDRLVYQQVFDPNFPKVWADYLEHRSLYPADGGPGLPLQTRLNRVTGGDLPAHQVFHPAIDLRNEKDVALLLAGETPEDRAAVARYADALAAARRTQAGFSAAAVRDDLTRRVLLEIWRCPERRFDTEASARGLVCGVRAVEASKRLMPGYLDEVKNYRKEEVTHGA
ncbi:TfuA-like protein [Streptomyces sp. enrichment culture]|uniref:TfuA-like protein n=1 Tax=Streptomyces sp. enrichment culture TaxID=1795815 RepID=UPI003F55EE60